jgi:MFS family permease
MKDWDKIDQWFIYRTLILLFFASGVVSFSYSFQILYIYNKFGITEAGMYLFVIQLTIFIFDYITGNFSDWIGQRGVMILAFITYSFSVSLFLIANTFLELMIIAFILGFAYAQFSGCFNSWFDNNYNVIADKYDPDYKLYPLFLVKISAISNINRIIFLTLGGLFAVQFSRQSTFGIQAILTFLGAFLTFFVMYDFPLVSKKLKEDKQSVIQNFKQGLRFMFLNSRNFLLILTQSLIVMEAYFYGTVWIIPFYALYLTTDFYIGVFNGILIFCTLSIQLFFINRITKKITNINKVYYIYFVAAILNFLLPLFYLSTQPTSNQLNFFNLTILLIIIVFLTTFAILGNVYLQRKVRNAVPSNIRSSVYSLQSTVTTILILILLPVFIFILDKYSIFEILLLDVSIYVICVIFTFFIFKFEKFESTTPLANNNPSPTPSD